MVTTNSVADGYDRAPEREWNRLVRDAYHSTEFLVYMHHITDHLEPGCLVLDAGGGPGRYAIELGRRGYDVVLLDVSKASLELASSRIEKEPPEVQARIKDVVLGDVADLSRFSASSFDAVLCLDPLSYFPKPEGRNRVMKELVRVAGPEALVAISVRGYLAVLRTILRTDPEALCEESLRPLREHGNTMVQAWTCHFFRAEELRTLGEAHGLRTILMAGAEGLSEGLPEATNALAEDSEKWEEWSRLLVATSTDSTVVDMSGHMLYLGRKAA